MMMNDVVVSQPGPELDKPTSPVTVIEELGKSQSLKPVFQTIKEVGPPHETHCEVVLTFGNCTWQGEGRSVKKAQLDAAKKALEQLGYPLPKKPSKKTKIANPASLTPTVILNGLAMARSETVKYTVVKKTPLPCQPIYNNNNNTMYNNSTNWQQQDPLNWNSKMYFGTDMKHPQTFTNGSFQSNGLQKYNGRPIKRWIHPQLFRIEVIVGERSFFGEGKTQQAARHDAAQRALDVLQTMPVPKKEKKSAADKKKEIGQGDGPAQAVEKSPISLLYEKASNHGLKIDFTVTSEEGPPHLKLFTMNIKVYKSAEEIITTAIAQGPNKHTAKKKSAIAALKNLEGLSLPEKKTKNTRRFKSNAKKDVETKIADILISKSAMHPISRLTQILQAKKESMPVYSLIPSFNESKTSFCIKCVVSDLEATGEGKNKKDAKKKASENMLKLMGYNFPGHDSKPDVLTQNSKANLTVAQQRKLQNKPTEPDILPPLIEC